VSHALRVALVQLTSGIDPAANAARVAEILARAAAAGARIAFTPEMTGLLDRDRTRLLSHAGDEADEPTLSTVRAIAARTGMWVQLGSLAIRPAPDAERLVNRAFLIDGTGAIVARYDKIHLFDVDLGEGQRYCESATFAPGQQAVVALTPWGSLALSICYDIRFPELYRALAEAAPAMIAVPAAFTRLTGEAHWHTLLRARAIETGAFVIAASQSGAHEDGRETFGHSLVVGPWGEVLLDMGEGAGVALIDLNLAEVEKARTRLPTLGHRRPFAGLAAV
jgi:predicted amidohydrolase